MRPFWAGAAASLLSLPLCWRPRKVAFSRWGASRGGSPSWPGFLSDRVGQSGSRAMASSAGGRGTSVLLLLMLRGKMGERWSPILVPGRRGSPGESLVLLPGPV